MSRGIIFDIKEMAIYDGPGLRVTVFFKGCPLRCVWCHNPEGLSPKPQVMRSRQGCSNCGKCERPCTHQECAGFGLCVKICQSGLLRVAGEVVDSANLASRLRQYTPVFGSSGGVTISGGEPLMQPVFLLDLLRELKFATQPKPLHTALETSGYGDTDVFVQAVELVDLVLFDIKLGDPEKHRDYTGVDSRLILRNFEILKASGKYFVLRMPIIPGVNDTREHFFWVAKLLRDVKDRVSVEILPYNPLAGAKYASAGLQYGFGNVKGDADRYYVEILEDEGVAVSIL